TPLFRSPFHSVRPAPRGERRSKSTKHTAGPAGHRPLLHPAPPQPDAVLVRPAPAQVSRPFHSVRPVPRGERRSRSTKHTARPGRTTWRRGAAAGRAVSRWTRAGSPPVDGRAVSRRTGGQSAGGREGSQALGGRVARVTSTSWAVPSRTTVRDGRSPEPYWRTW